MTRGSFDRISVEPSRKCAKGCRFCYNGSNAEASWGGFSEDELVAFAADCAAHGVRAISIGGGEPLEWAGIVGTLHRLDGILFRSLTTNGLPLLDRATLETLVAARPDKVHVSIHFPHNDSEVTRVIEQVTELSARGVRSGVNLLVRRSRLADASSAAARLHAAGISNERIVYLPMRGDDTPTPREIADLARGPFQSMTCLNTCGKSPRFASIAADKSAAWCSYTQSRRVLSSLSYAALVDALDGLGLEPCASGRLARLGHRPELRE